MDKDGLVLSLDIMSNRHPKCNLLRNSGRGYVRPVDPVRLEIEQEEDQNRPEIFDHEHQSP